MPKAAPGAAKSRTGKPGSSGGSASRTPRTARPTGSADAARRADAPAARTAYTEEPAPPEREPDGTSPGPPRPNAGGEPARSAGPSGLLRRLPRWWPLPACALLGLLGGTVYAASAAPEYAATGYVVVSPRGGAESASALGYAQAYGKIATDAMILTGAETRYKLPLGSLRPHVRASTSPDAPMVQITGTSDRPAQAAHYADAVARSLTRTAKKSAKKTGVRLTVVSHAVAPDSPVSPSTPIALSVGGCAGGLVGGLVLLARPPRRRGLPAGAAAVPAPGHRSPEPAETEREAVREPRGATR